VEKYSNALEHAAMQQSVCASFSKLTLADSLHYICAKQVPAGVDIEDSL